MAIYISSLEKISVQIICPFVKWMVCFVLFCFLIEFCELFNYFGYQLLIGYDLQALIIFCSVSLLFILLIVYFAELFNLMPSQLFIFCLYCLALCCQVQEKIITNNDVKEITAYYF